MGEFVTGDRDEMVGEEAGEKCFDRPVNQSAAAPERRVHRPEGMRRVDARHVPSREAQARQGSGLGTVAVNDVERPGSADDAIYGA